VNGNQPLIVGEILFDEFPDGNSVLGGAPFNVAWNLQGLGLKPLLVTAVGEDAQGKQAVQTMKSWEMDTRCVQTASDVPTGKVHVSVSNGEPTFNILDETAYDRISYPKELPSFDHFSLLYLGSLAYRHDYTRSTVNRLIAESGLPRFVDINLRKPWYERSSLLNLLQNATWTKLNLDELSMLSGNPCRDALQIEQAVEKMRELVGGGVYFVTCGSAGAYAYPPQGESIFASAPQPAPMVDAVGAGDAFSSAAIYGIIHKQPLEALMQNAVQFACKACTIQGATSTDKSRYTIAQ